MDSLSTTSLFLILHKKRFIQFLQYRATQLLLQPQTHPSMATTTRSSCPTYKSLANKENWIPPSTSFSRMTEKAKPTVTGGITKPLANRALRKVKLPRDHMLAIAGKFARMKILVDGFTRNIINQKAKRLTQLPLGDPLEAYSPESFC